MVNFWAEYLCQDCLKSENKPLRQRQIEARERRGDE